MGSTLVRVCGRGIERVARPPVPHGRLPALPIHAAKSAKGVLECVPWTRLCAGGIELAAVAVLHDRPRADPRSGYHHSDHPVDSKEAQ